MKSTSHTTHTHTTEPAVAPKQRRSHRRTPHHTNNISNSISNSNSNSNSISNSNSNSNSKTNDIDSNSNGKNNGNGINERHKEVEAVSAADVSVCVDLEAESSPHDPAPTEQPSLSPEISLFANISGFFSKIARSVSLSNNDERSNSTSQQEPTISLSTRPNSVNGDININSNSNSNSTRETPINHRNHRTTVASAAHTVTAVQKLSSREHPKQSGISHPRSAKTRRGSPKRPIRSSPSNNPSAEHPPIIMKGLKVQGSMMTASAPDFELNIESAVELAQQQTVPVTRLNSTKIPMPPMAPVMPVQMSIQMAVHVPIQDADQSVFDTYSDQDLSQLELEMKRQTSNSGFKPAVHQVDVDLDSLFMAEDKLQKRRLVCCRGVRRAPCVPTAVMCCLYKNYSVGCRKACGCFYPWNQEDLIGMGAVAMLQLKSVEHVAECCCGLSYQCCCDVFSVTTSCWKTICCGLSDSDVDGLEKAHRFTACGGLFASWLSQTFKCVKSTAFSTSKCSSGLASSVYEYLKEIFSSAGSSSADAGDAIKEFACNACQDSCLRYINPCEWCQTIIALR